MKSKKPFFYPFKRKHFLSFFESASATPQEFYDWFLVANARCRLIYNTGGTNWYFPCLKNLFKDGIIIITADDALDGHYLETKSASLYNIWDRTIKWPWYKKEMIKGFLMMFPEVN